MVAQTRSKSIALLRQKAFRFTRYLHYKKGMLRTLDDIVLWIGNEFPPKYATRSGGFNIPLTPDAKYIWFCKKAPANAPHFARGGIVLCACIHSPLVHCLVCNADDSDDIKDDYIFIKKRARCLCILWNKPEDMWV